MAQGSVKICGILCAYMKRYHTLLDIKTVFLSLLHYIKNKLLSFFPAVLTILHFIILKSVQQEKVVKLIKWTKVCINYLLLYYYVNFAMKLCHKCHVQWISTECSYALQTLTMIHSKPYKSVLRIISTKC